MKGFLQRILQEIMKKNNTWNIRRLVDDSFVPSSKQPSVLYCKLTDFKLRKWHFKRDFNLQMDNLFVIHIHKKCFSLCKSLVICRKLYLMFYFHFSTCNPFQNSRNIKDFLDYYKKHAHILLPYQCGWKV